MSSDHQQTTSQLIEDEIEKLDDEVEAARIAWKLPDDEATLD